MNTVCYQLTIVGFYTRLIVFAMQVPFKKASHDSAAVVKQILYKLKGFASI